MKRYVTFLCICTFILGCGKLDITPRKHREGEIVYIFNQHDGKPSDAALSFATYQVAQQFDQYLGDTPENQFCCGDVEIYVTDQKPLAPIYNKKVKEFAQPQAYSKIWRKNLFGDKRGIYYNLGKHFIDVIFPAHYNTYEKVKHVEYHHETRTWEVDLDPEDARKGR